MTLAKITQKRPGASSVTSVRILSASAAPGLPGMPGMTLAIPCAGDARARAHTGWPTRNPAKHANPAGTGFETCPADSHVPARIPTARILACSDRGLP